MPSGTGPEAEPIRDARSGNGSNIETILYELYLQWCETTNEACMNAIFEEFCQVTWPLCFWTLSRSGCSYLLTQQEWQQEARLLLLRVLRSFTPGRGALTHFLRWCWRNRINDCARRARRQAKLITFSSSDHFDQFVQPDWHPINLAGSTLRMAPGVTLCSRGLSYGSW